MATPRHIAVTTPRAPRAPNGPELENRLRSNGGASHEGCRPVVEVLARVGDKWTALVVILLGNGPKRFNELRRLIGVISQRMLTMTLRALERDGIVTREVFPTIPPRVDYELTPLGRSLIEPITALADWAQANRGAMEKARTAFDQRAVGLVLPADRTVHRIADQPARRPPSRAASQPVKPSATRRA